MTLLLVVLSAGVYAGALPLYLLFRVSRPALALGAATEATTSLNAQLMRRDSALHQTVRIVHALARAASPRVDSLALARRLLVAGRRASTRWRSRVACSWPGASRSTRRRMH